MLAAACGDYTIRVSCAIFVGVSFERSTPGRFMQTRQIFMASCPSWHICSQDASLFTCLQQAAHRLADPVLASLVSRDWLHCVQVCALSGSAELVLEEHVKLQGHSYHIHDITWPQLAGRGACILSAGADSSVRLWDKSHWHCAALEAPEPTQATAPAARAELSRPSNKQPSGLASDAAADEAAASMPGHGTEQNAPIAAEQSEQENSPELPPTGLSPIIESPRPQAQPPAASNGTSKDQPAVPGQQGLAWTRPPQSARGRGGRGRGRRPRRSRCEYVLLWESCVCSWTRHWCCAMCSPGAQGHRKSAHGSLCLHTWPMAHGLSMQA